MGLAEVDAINIRAYGGKDFDVGDRVVLSKLGMGAPAASNKAALTVTGPSMAGTIVSRSKTAGGNSWDVVSDVGRKGSFAESQLMHTGRNFDRQVGPRTTLQIDSEYVWKKPKGGGGGGNSSMFGSFLSGGAGGGKHHDFAVVLKKLEPPNGQLVTVELFDPETKDWHVHEHVPRTELLLPPGLTFQNTGKTVDICRSHIAHSYCITSRALYRYMHGHPTDNAHAAIELNCLATTDRRTVRGQGWGGSNCARYLRTQPPYDHFRIGEDGNWKVDGNITWDNVEPQHPLSAETPFL
ncbi:unnamed protein product [Amoebophrya sp. A25]|nr:unnamed protein product [Amoebophrya sp. A25]|eukprot:GSA25T00009196001.1